MPPKSEKLVREEQEQQGTGESFVPPVAEVPEPVTSVEIRPIKCYNDFVAILQSELDTSGIALPDSDEKYKNEGIVVGVGPGVPSSEGRCTPTVQVGETVIFGVRNIVTTIQPSGGTYANKKVVIVSERNIMCGVPSKVEVKVVEDAS